MDDLTNTLLQRQLPTAGKPMQPSKAAPPPTGLTAPTWPAPATPKIPGSIPTNPPPMPTPRATVPPQVQRFQTAQKMQDAYRNNWTPNPLLIRILEGK